MLPLRKEELAYFQSSLSQEVPFSLEPPSKSAQPATLVLEPTPQPGPVTAETVARLLREREGLVREREEFRLQVERARIAKELLRLGLPETPERSLGEAELELMMECQMVDMHVQSER